MPGWGCRSDGSKESSSRTTGPAAVRAEGHHIVHTEHSGPPSITANTHRFLDIRTIKKIGQPVAPTSTQYAEHVFPCNSPYVSIHVYICHCNQCNCKCLSISHCRGGAELTLQIGSCIDDWRVFLELDSRPGGREPLVSRIFWGLGRQRICRGKTGGFGK